MKTTKIILAALMIVSLMYCKKEEVIEESVAVSSSNTANGSNTSTNVNACTNCYVLNGGAFSDELIILDSGEVNLNDPKTSMFFKNADGTPHLYMVTTGVLPGVFEGLTYDTSGDNYFYFYADPVSEASQGMDSISVIGNGFGSMDVEILNNPLAGENLTGTFTGTTKSAQGDIYTISDGKFTIPRID